MRNTRIALCVLLALAAHASGQTVQLQPIGSFTIEEGVTERSLLTDVNGDGLPDVVLRIDFPLGVRVKLAQGDGTFGPVVSSPAFSDEAFGFAVGHLNADAFADAVVGNPLWDSSNLAVLLNNGNGAFASGGGLQNGSSAFPLVAIGDVNGDGRGDIVSNTFGGLSVILGDGNGLFGAPLQSGAAGTVGDMLLSDLDGDDDLDSLQVSDSLNNNNANSTLRINLNDGAGAFTPVQSSAIAARVTSGFLTPGYALARLNNDDLPDLAVFGLRGTNSGPGGLYLFLNTGGQLQQSLHIPYSQLGQGASKIGVGDFNGDGFDDVVVPRFGAFDIRISNGAGGFTETLTFAGPADGDAALIGDFAGSGLVDLIIIEQPIGPVETFHLYENVTSIVLPGDTNCDGLVTVADIGGFVLALTDPAAYAAQFPDCDINNADMNNDGNITVSDIGLFVQTLTSA